MSEIDVVAVESDRLADAHPGHIQQPDERRDEDVYTDSDSEAVEMKRGQLSGSESQ